MNQKGMIVIEYDSPDNEIYQNQRYAFEQNKNPSRKKNVEEKFILKQQNWPEFQIDIS